ncbi:MAG: glycosyl hydrolase family 76 [Bacteroidia bacterium]|nr:glycosyl hydrolase family 76 [Bacteroidia bacterium]
MKKLIIMCLACVAVLSSCEEDYNNIVVTDNRYAIDWNAAADSSSTGLISNFWNSTSNYFNYTATGTEFHYWPQAHGLDVLLDAYERTKDESYKSYFDKWFTGVKAKNGNTFLNFFYDDMQWNALSMLRAYNATDDEKYKTATIVLWDDIKTGWNDKGGGGIAWNKGELNSKNACSNGPACILAARLYQQFNDAADLEWATKIYNWEKEVLFNPSNGAIYDNLNASTGVISNYISTYNQGTFIGSAVELYKITGEKTYLNDAIKAANYTINKLTANRILNAEGSGDLALFKGIFVRYFTQLIQTPGLDAATKKRFVLFLKYNANELWYTGTNKQYVVFKSDWKSAPYFLSETELNAQLSGSMLIEAAASLKKSGDMD